MEMLQQRFTFLAEAGRVLASSLDYEITLASVVRLAIPVLADWCVVELLGEHDTIHRVAIAHADPHQEAVARDMRRRYPLYVQRDRSAAAEVLRTGQAMITANISLAHLQHVAHDADHLRLLCQLHPRCNMCVPLIAHGRTLGALSFRSVHDGQRYGPDDLALAEELAQHAALAVDNARLYRELQESQQMLQAVLDNIPQHVFWKDRHSVYLGCNAVFARPLGCTPQDVVGMTDAAMVSQPEDAEWFRRVDCRVMEQDQAEYRIIEQVHRADGTVSWVETNKVPLHNAAGQVVGILGIFEDITEGREALVARRESEEQYRALFEESHDAILMTTPGGQCLDANQGALVLFGYTREEMLQLRLHELSPDLRVRKQSLQDLAVQGALRDHEIQLRRKDGSTLDCVITVSVWRAADGSIRSYQAIIRDVTERKRLETRLHQVQRMEAIGTLAGGIAHDFNNILAVIIGYTELTLDEVSRESLVWRNLQAVFNAGMRAKDLVQQILMFSRQHAPAYRPLKLHLVVQDALKLLRASLPTTVAIHPHVETVPGIVRADPTQMHQVLMNLGSNAEHAMRTTGGILEVRLEALAISADFATFHPPLQAGPHLRLTVRDTGHGIERHLLERIFEPFFTTKEIGEGTGLGLAVVHGIITNHEGAITVESTPGQGTTFEMYLPRLAE